MAREEHLAVLKLGAVVWNNWRTLNPDIVPDLSGTNLTDVVCLKDKSLLSDSRGR